MLIRGVGVASFFLEFRLWRLEATTNFKCIRLNVDQQRESYFPDRALPSRSSVALLYSGHVTHRDLRAAQSVSRLPEERRSGGFAAWAVSPRV